MPDVREKLDALIAALDEEEKSEAVTMEDLVARREARAARRKTLVDWRNSLPSQVRMGFFTGEDDLIFPRRKPVSRNGGATLPSRIDALLSSHPRRRFVVAEIIRELESTGPALATAKTPADVVVWTALQRAATSHGWKREKRKNGRVVWFKPVDAEDPRTTAGREGSV